MRVLGVALACALLLTSHSPVARALLVKKADKALIEHLRSSGAQIDGLLVGRKCETCLRGAFATQGFKAGAAIATLPFELAVWLNEPQGATTRPYGAELAYELAVAMHANDTFNTTSKAWWETQPSPEDTWVPEALDDGLIEAMQSEWMAGYTRAMRHLAEDVYNGTFSESHLQSLPEAVGKGTISLDAFLHLAALIVSRDFSFMFEDGRERSFMLPIFDMLNDKPPHLANARRVSNETHVTMEALQPIKRGDELFWSYNPTTNHRPDLSLLVYGYAVETDPPQLAAQDLPRFDPKNPWQPTAFSFDADLPKGRDELAEELERYQGILNGLPTTQKQDEAELAATPEEQWRLRTILSFRIERKRALAHRIKLLKAALAEL